MKSGNMLCEFYKNRYIYICIFFVLFAHPRPSLSEENHLKEIIHNGVTAYENGSYDDAVRYFKKGVIEYGSSSAMLNLGITYDKELNFYPKAKHFYKKFLKKEPNAPEAAMVMERISFIQDKRDSAEKTIPKEELERTPLVPLVLRKKGKYTIKGNEYFKKNNYTNAVVEYRKGLFLNNSEIACFNLAMLYYEYLHFNDKALYFFKLYLSFGKNKALLNTASDVIKLIERDETVMVKKEIRVLRLRTK